MTQSLEEIIGHESGDKTGPSLTKRGVVILGISGAVFAGVYAVTVPFLVPALRKICLPFVPATPAQIRNVYAALKGRSGTLIDIGSGDGRIVLEGARLGFNSRGVELNLWLVLYSRLTAWRAGLGHVARFSRKDLWKTSLSQYDNVVIFGVEQMMEPLQKKLAVEMAVNSRVVACRFPLPLWEPIATVGQGIDTVWLYRKQ